MRTYIATLALALVVACSDDDAAPTDGAADASADRSGDATLGDGGLDRSTDLGAEASSDAIPSDGTSTDRDPAEVPPAALLEITPATHNFGAVAKDAIVTHFFVVKNTGGQASGSLDIKLMNGTLDPSAFDIVANGCETSLEPAASCEIELRFFANVRGSHEGLLTAAAAPGGMASAALQATVP